MRTRASIITVGDELLAGEIQNTNASWIASQLTDRGVEVRQIRVLPDEIDEIATAIRELGRSNTFVIVTGGLGSTPDDITVRGVANGLDLPLESHPEARQLIEATIAAKREQRPGFPYDIDAASQYPKGARIIANPEGIAPGCVCGNVYVLPGMPEEMKTMFDRVKDEFDGDIQSCTLYSDTSESQLNSVLNEVREEFGVRVGCYPSRDHKRIRLVSEDETILGEAYEWLGAQTQIQSEPN